MSKYPVFQYIPFETLISESQEDYYKVLAECDKRGESTAFIEYMLKIIDNVLGDLLSHSLGIKMTQEARLHHFYSLQKGSFTRKEYMQVFKQLSSASASRDLKKGVEIGLFMKTGDKSLTTYHLNNRIDEF